MSRYRGPKLKITRRLGSLPGLTTKKSRKLNRPGKDGNSPEMGKKLSEYGTVSYTHLTLPTILLV